MATESLGYITKAYVESLAFYSRIATAFADAYSGMTDTYLQEKYTVSIAECEKKMMAKARDAFDSKFRDQDFLKSLAEFTGTYSKIAKTVTLGQLYQNVSNIMALWNNTMLEPLRKNAVALEEAGKINAVILDKIGTLTLGQPKVVEIVTAKGGPSEAEILRLVASVEEGSEHPLAQAILERAHERGIRLGNVSGFDAIPGHGVSAIVDGRRVLVGNRKLMRNRQIGITEVDSRAAELQGAGRTVIMAAVDGRLEGAFAVADAVRPTSREAVKRLTSMGIQVAMLTGDNRATAERIAAELEIKTVFADVLPGDKAAKFRELQAQGKRVAMVGDGINDGPALAQADVGIAISAGTDVATETADVVLTRSDPLDVAKVVLLSRAMRRKMQENLWWAAGYNMIAFPIAAGILYIPQLA
jgi:P-type Cu2+ transporter